LRDLRDLRLPPYVISALAITGLDDEDKLDVAELGIGAEESVTKVGIDELALFIPPIIPRFHSLLR
jgi:hypothetical protein